MGRLEAGGPEQGIQNQFVNLLRLNKLILVVPGGGKAGGWGGPGQGIQNQFVEAQQIDFGCSGPWEGWRLGRHPGRESKMNLLRLNKLILVVQGRGKLQAGRFPAGNPKSIC